MVTEDQQTRWTFRPVRYDAMLSDRDHCRGIPPESGGEMWPCDLEDGERTPCALGWADFIVAVGTAGRQNQEEPTGEQNSKSSSKSYIH